MSKAIYPSKYTDRKVTDAQYLTDVVMERIAAQVGKTLPYKYWYSEEWSKDFKHQLARANALLKEADCLNIMTFLRTKSGQKIYSLGLKKEILDGANKFVTVAVKAIENKYFDIYSDAFIQNIAESDQEIQSSERTQSSLWEKL